MSNISSVSLVGPNHEGLPLAAREVDVGKQRFHRVAEARRAQEVSITTATQRLGWSRQRVKASEEETFDLTISELLQWQEALGVPLQELLVEPDQDLSRPVLERAQLLRMMKAVLTLGELVTSQRAKRLIGRLTDQFVEIMPELQSARAWSPQREERSCEFSVVDERTFTPPTSRG